MMKFIMILWSESWWIKSQNKNRPAPDILLVKVVKKNEDKKL